MPNILPRDFNERVTAAVAAFWTGRSLQAEHQRKAGRVKDAGTRSSVTAGGHMNGFVTLVGDCLVQAGVPKDSIIRARSGVVIPGFYRPTKQWDLLVVHKGQLLAAVEFKSQVGSIGNNLNNRTEEALGNSTDVFAAYEKGLLRPGPRPWLGWLMVLEDSAETNSPVSVREPHFKIDPVFQGASYSQRYIILGRRMLHKGVYDGAAVILTPREAANSGKYREPDKELAIRKFMAGLVAKALAGIES